jgi:Transthyretin-like family
MGVTYSVNPDDRLNRTRTDNGGFFELTGAQFEYNLLRPYLYITHGCSSDFPEYWVIQAVTSSGEFPLVPPTTPHVL